MQVKNGIKWIMFSEMSEETDTQELQEVIEEENDIFEFEVNRG